MAKNKRTSIYFDRELIEFVGLDENIKKQLKEVYNKVNVDIELKKMSIWLLSTKGKGRKGDLSFINGWLRRACPQSISIPEEVSVSPDSALSSLRQDYLRLLWQGKEHILEFNRKKI